MLPRWLTETAFSVVDIETTGLDHDTDRVVQVAVVQIDGGEIAGEWCRIVDPERPIPAEASAIHGITDAMVAGAPTFAAIAPELARRCSGRTLCGYNAAHFDTPFLRAALRRIGRPVSDRVPLDALVWLREIDRYVAGKARHKLTVACERHGVVFDGAGAHDAAADCRATWRLFLRLVASNPGVFPSELPSVLSKQTRLAIAQERDFQAWLAKQPKRAAA